MRIKEEITYPNAKIDIVLLTCNREKDSKKTIDDLFERVSYPDKIRLIVVDNNSKDGTYDMLRKYKEDGKVSVLLSSPDDSTISDSYNIGFKCVQSEYFIMMQDDITIPKYDDYDVIERLIALMEKYPEQEGIGCRIQRIPNVNWQAGDDFLAPARKALSAYFRIQTKAGFSKMDMLNPKKTWDDVNFQDRVRNVLNKDCSWAKKLWCDHSRGYCENRGYNVIDRKWGWGDKVGSHSRNQDIKEKPYPEINPLTCEPI